MKDLYDGIDLFKRRTPGSKRLWEEALKTLPGGVTASSKYWAPYPIFFSKAKGSKLWDVDENEYIDYNLSFGPLILGHGHPEVVDAIKRQLDEGGTTHYGMPHELMVTMSKKIIKLVPSAESMRYTNSGSEATIHAIRLSRAYSGKPKLAKFEGHYHGTHDYAQISVYPPLEEAGPSHRPKTYPNSLGNLKCILDNTIVLPFNDLENTTKLIKEHKNELAGVILEPVSRGFLKAEKEFLKGLREVTEENDLILIFDEVMSGFRYGIGGAQEYFDITPDLTTLGKIMGGGLPAGALVGKREIMELISPIQGTYSNKTMYHSGTYNGCALVLAAGLKTLEILEREGSYEHINGVADELKKGMCEMFEDKRIDYRILGGFSMICPVFTSHDIKNYRDTLKVDTKKRETFDFEMLSNGVYIRPNRAFYTCLANTKEDVTKTLKAIEGAAEKIAS